MKMKLTVVSYNLWFHRAYPEVNRLVQRHGIDILCLQECFTDELKSKAGNLVLAEAHTYAVNPPPIHPEQKRLSGGKILNGNIGIALYYNDKILKLLDITNYQLPLPWPERKGGRTLQLARFLVPASKQILVVGNVHLSALWATNSARRKQLQEGLEHLSAYQQGAPAILAGDFNYPVAIRKLRELMAGHGFQECGQLDRRPTHTSRVIKGKFDRIFLSTAIEECDYATLPFESSDHAPVLTTLNLSPSNQA